ncbi:clavesin-2 [Caerostris darwini]|uniref:Clavesin-2 n=1 Tax=Caerostris darwini TaxID=1538125 RepID=A0AAV4PV27_9ARAC|nr:clavesin-2 [Caerostris darwini]
MSNWDVNKYDIISVINYLTLLMLSALDEPITQVSGLHVFLDLSGTTLQHVRCLTPRFLYLVAKGCRDTFPVRYKAFHLFNASPAFHYIWAVLKFFLTAKFKKRVHFHDDLESVGKFLPKEILPTEYGGENDDFDPAKLGETEAEKFLPKYVEIIHNNYRIN